MKKRFSKTAINPKATGCVRYRYGVLKKFVTAVIKSQVAEDGQLKKLLLYESKS